MIQCIGRMVAAIVVLAVSQPALGQEDPAGTRKQDKSARQSPLINVATLQQMLGQKNVRLIELGKREEYNGGHIPNAVFLHWLEDITDQQIKERYNLIKPEVMQQLLRRCGVKNDDYIVLYDSLASRLATRFYWSLKVYGHRRILILNGGKQAWLAGKNTLTNVVPSVAPSQYRVAKINKQLSADMKFIGQHIGDKDVTFVDGRPPAQFSGEEPGRVFHTGTPHKQRGHVPGAAHVFWKDNFNPDGTFKSVKQLRALYKEHGVVAGGAKTTVTYCNEGLHAAPPWFVLHELLGFKDVRVYDDSMSEWANSKQPMETGPSRQKKPDDTPAKEK